MRQLAAFSPCLLVLLGESACFNFVDAGQCYGGACAGAAGSPPCSSSYHDAVLADSPIAYWRLGEANGSTAHDEIADADGTLSAGVYPGAPGAVACDTAMRFDSGCIDMGDRFDFAGESPFSIEAWIHPTQAPAGESSYFLVKLDEAKANGYAMRLSSDQLTFRYFVGSPEELAVLSHPGTALDAWSHVVVTVAYPDSNGADMTLYVNGAFADTNTDITSLLPDVAGAFVLGCLGPTAPNPDIDALHGTLDEAAMYATALTAQQVEAHYAAATQP